MQRGLKNKGKEMKEKTAELIAACKEAGYEHLTVFTENENVPESKIRPSGYGQYKGRNILICAHPERLEENGEPKMWGIVRGLGLNPHGGSGYADCFPVHRDLLHLFDAGYYDLSEATK